LRRILLALTPILFLVAAASAADRALTTIAPAEDPSAVLHNPDMGWVLYENHVVDSGAGDSGAGGSSTMLTLPGESFPGVDEVAVMFAWSDVEHRAGEFNFDKVDRACDYWRKLGKRIQLRMSTESLLWWNARTPPTGVGIPESVLHEIPADQKKIRKTDGVEYTVVDARNGQYLDRLDRFLAAVAKHFGDDRPVTLIDLRGFGVWGEWHTGYPYKTLDDRREALKAILDHWSAALPHHYLALSYSFDPDSPEDLHNGPTDQFDAAFTKRYDDFVRYSAFDYAMTKANITLRRDGVGGAVRSNERKLNREAFETLAKGPMSCEYVTYYSQAKPAGLKWLSFLIDDALSLHPNYINLLGYSGGDALAFLKEQPELFARGLREMGYRLLPTHAAFPSTIRAGEAFEMQTAWTNQAVGRAIRDFHLIVALTDPAGKQIALADGGVTGCDKWIKGKSYDLKSRATFKDVPPGQYTLRIGLRDGERAIALPLRDGDGQTYPLGAITVEKP
jgi:hypothetical protein